MDQIKEKQLEDESLVARFQQVKEGETSEFGSQKRRCNSNTLICLD